MFIPRRCRGVICTLSSSDGPFRRMIAFKRLGYLWDRKESDRLVGTERGDLLSGEGHGVCGTGVKRESRAERLAIDPFESRRLLSPRARGASIGCRSAGMGVAPVWESRGCGVLTGGAGVVVTLWRCSER